MEKDGDGEDGPHQTEVAVKYRQRQEAHHHDQFAKNKKHPTSPAEKKDVKNKKAAKNSRLPPDANIGIIGGGIAGLSAALALQNDGFSNVTVYEKSDTSDLKNKGYGLTLSYNPKGPLAKLGVLEDVVRMDVPSRSHYVFRSDGKILGYYGNAFLPDRGHGQRGNLRIPRPTLLKLLSSKLNPGTIQYSKKFLRFQHEEQKLPPPPVGVTDDDYHENDANRIKRVVQVYFQDGSKDCVDLLVGADGIRSTLRSSSTHPDSSNIGGNTNTRNGLSYLGVVLILGISHHSHFLLNSRGFYTLDGTHRLFTMPFDEGRTMWQLTFKLEDEVEAGRLVKRNSHDLKNEVLKRCAAWHDPVTDIVRETELDTIWATTLMDLPNPEMKPPILPSNRRDIKSHVTLMGDAIHPMSPFKGQGANQSLLDGPLLVSYLKRSKFYSALDGFERAMIDRSSHKVKASREAAKMLHQEDVLHTFGEFAGVEGTSVDHFLTVLEEKGINASSCADNNLDTIVSELIQELGVGVGMDPLPYRNRCRAVISPDDDLDRLREKVLA